MAKNYSYKPPLGLDIRIKPPKEEAKKRAAVKPCAWPGCENKGEHPAPKSSDERDYQYFCLEHIRAYNKQWNYFQGMKDEDIKQFMEESHTGHRPTWKMGTQKTGKDKKESPSFQSAAEGISYMGNVRDPHDLLGAANAGKVKPKRSLTKAQKEAFETLDLDTSADKKKIKLRYKDLAKRYHPDTNGGDNAAVERLKHVIKAYQTLKSAGFTD